MAEPQRELPVILKLYDLIVWTMKHTAKFPRHHRYSLGAKIETTLLNLLDNSPPAASRRNVLRARHEN